MVNRDEATHIPSVAQNAEAAYTMVTGCERASTMALSDKQWSQSVAHRKMADTQSKAERCEDHPPSEQKDQPWSLYPRSHPPLTEAQAVPLEQESPCDRE